MLRPQATFTSRSVAMLADARMQVKAASKCPPNRRKSVQRQICVQVIALAVGPKGGIVGLEEVEEAIARAKRLVESRAARIHCSIALARASGGQEVVRLCRWRMTRAFIRWQTGANMRGSRGSWAACWKEGGNAAMQEAKWVSKVARVDGEIVGDLRVLISWETARTTWMIGRMKLVRGETPLGTSMPASWM
jgi:hypothetical protein